MTQEDKLDKWLKELGFADDEESGDCDPDYCEIEDEDNDD